MFGQESGGDHSILTILATVCMLAWMQIPVIRVCRRNPVLAHWRPLLMFSTLVWAAVILIKDLVIGDAWVSDAAMHELAARDIAYRFLAGDVQSALELFGPGNSGLRFVTGLFYAVTGAPGIFVVVFFSVLTFSGLLTLLDVLIRATNAKRCPLWLVLVICLYPEGLVWATDFLKEGPVFWGLCTMLQLMVPDPARPGLKYKIMPMWGALVAMFFRPHITFMWLVAMALAHAIRTRRIGAICFTTVAALIAFFFMQMLAPGLIGAALRGGMMEALEQSLYSQRHGTGSTIRGTPIPIVSGFVMLFLRPFPNEAPHYLGFLAGLEVWLLSATAAFNWLFLQRRRQALKTPLMLTMLFAIVLLSFYFSYVYNLGLMVRYRMQAFPAIIALAGVPSLVRRSPQYIAARARGPAHHRMVRPLPLPPGRRIAYPMPAIGMQARRRLP